MRPKISVDKEYYLLLLEQVSKFNLEEKSKNVSMKFNLLNSAVSLVSGLEKNIRSISEFMNMYGIGHIIFTWMRPIDMPTKIDNSLFNMPIGNIQETSFLDLEISSNAKFSVGAYSVNPIALENKLIGVFIYTSSHVSAEDANVLDLVTRTILQATYIFEQAYHIFKETNTKLVTCPLMGIGNKNGMNEDLPSFYSLNVSMMDIDKFKHVNDNYGHQVGDIVLKKLGEVLNKHKVLGLEPYRIGGDEICILSNHKEILKEYIDKVREEFCSIVFRDNMDREFSCTLSIGIAEDCHNIELGMSWADYAMYIVKELGRNDIKVLKCKNIKPDIKSIKEDKESEDK